MPTVTSITPQRREGYVNIFLDGKYSFSLDESALLKASLRRGDELSAEQVSKLKDISSRVKQFDVFLRFAMIRPRSLKELRDYLKYKKKVDLEDVREELITRLTKLGLVNDHGFALWWVEQRFQQKKGSQLIRRELQQKGVAPEIIESALEEGVQDELLLAKTFLLKKANALRRVLPEKRYPRALAWLVGRGFSFDVARETALTIIKEMA